LVFASNFNNNTLTLYTSRILSPEITLENIDLLNQWSAKLHEFISTHIENSNIFYDNATLLDKPIIHSITTCKLQEQAVMDCQQRHLIENSSSAHYLDKDNFYIWTTTHSRKSNLLRTTPNSRLYQFSLSNPVIKMAQVEGAPISENSLSIKTPTLSAIIYQNDTHAPTWHSAFTKNKLARFNLNINELSTDGSFVNSSDNYNLLALNYTDIIDDSKKIIATTPSLIILDDATSTINIYDESMKSLSIDGKILDVKKIPATHKLLIVSKKDMTITAQIFDIDTATISSPFVLQENTQIPPLIEASLFQINNKLFASIAFTEKTSGKGSIHLLDVSVDPLIQLDNFIFTKNYQRLNDGCQNDCHQSWQDQARYFPSPKLSPNNTFIYATAGSKLRKIVIDNKNTARLLKTIDYTYRPAPPKPKLPTARIPGGAKRVNGKYVCKKKHDYVGKSKANNKGYLHLDLECCLDPDEYPNPWCTYRPGELSVTKLRYKDYHGRVKKKKH